MDETPEELEKIREEAAKIDPYRYRRRNRALGAVALGALLAGMVFVGLEAFDKARNPCKRVHDHLCKQDPASLNCQAYQALLRESLEEASREMRSSIRHQCATKIARLKEDGIEVP
jgi:hypothetical protein